RSGIQNSAYRPGSYLYLISQRLRRGPFARCAPGRPRLRTPCSYSASLIAVKPHFSVHRDCDKPINLYVLELHDLVSAAGELSPATRFFGILLDSLILAPLDRKGDGPETLCARAANRLGMARNRYLRAAHQLGWRSN